MDAKLRVDIRKWVEGQVINNHRWSERLYSLQIEAPIEDVQAGQFGRLGLVIDEELVGRPYSFVNAPDERPLEFYFITVPGGPVSNRLIKLEPGAPIWVARKPAGFFTLSEVQDAESLWLFATGTALGPFLSILKTDEPWERFPKIILIHAVRTAEELTYRDVIKRFQDQHQDQFTMVPFVSRENHPPAIRGRITEALKDGRLEERVGVLLTADRSQVMICGNPDMVHDTTALLVERGLKENRRREPGQITTERYW